MNTRERWAKVLIIVGYIAMLVGAVDPLEGSFVILPGSALVALGTFMSRSERELIAYRSGVFVLIAVGVGAMFGLSAVGGIGGKAGHSLWWGVLILPYLIGWFMGIWGPGNPRWVHLAGILVGVWYLAIPVMVLVRANPSRPTFPAAIIAIGVLGVVIVGGGLWRLRHRATPA